MFHDEKSQSFVQYLRERQIEGGYFSEELLNEISDDDILLAYRKDHNGNDAYTKEQERSVMMEYSSNEGIIQALEGLKEFNHLDKVENDLKKEFSDRIKPISLSGKKFIPGFLRKLKAINIEIGFKDLEEVVREGCSIFAEWILDSRKYYVREYEDRRFAVDAEEVCTACFLNETTHNYRTLLGWSFMATNGESDGKRLKTIKENMLTEVADALFYSIAEKNPDGPSDESVLSDVLADLFEEIYDYVVDLPLIVCWLEGKDIAHKRFSEHKERESFLKETHEHFCEIYGPCIKESDCDRFINDLGDYIKKISWEQLELLNDVGLPIEVPKKLNRKIKKTFKTQMGNQNGF